MEADLSMLEGLVGGEMPEIGIDPFDVQVKSVFEKFNSIMSHISGSFSYEKMKETRIDKKRASEIRTAIRQSLKTKKSCTLFGVNNTEAVICIGGLNSINREVSLNMSDDRLFETIAYEDGFDHSIFGLEGQFFLSMNMWLPSYCDDECDGVIDSMSIAFFPEEEDAKIGYESAINSFISKEMSKSIEQLKQRALSLIGNDSLFGEINKTLNQAGELTKLIK